MSNRIVLSEFQLIPVLELDYSDFKSEDRPYLESPTTEERQQFWLDSLADSGINGLMPIDPWSSCVPISAVPDASLESLLEATILRWGGMESLLADEPCSSLDGGLILQCEQPSLFIVPRCCTNLKDVNSWREASVYRDTEWQILWIGHPWLMVKYEAPWLLLAESDDLVKDASAVIPWAVDPEQFANAIAAVDGELNRLAERIAALLPSLGNRVDPETMSRQLLGWK